MVQFPVGKPVNTTLPVASAQVGCVMVPIVGDGGVTGCAFITTLAEAADKHPKLLVTIKLYVPVLKPFIVTVAVLPFIPPGFMVQSPVGKLLNTTLPVATVHVGWLIVPTTGGVGITAVITILDVAGDVHPTELVTVKL